MTEKTLIIYKNPPAFSGGFFLQTNSIDEICSQIENKS